MNHLGGVIECLRRAALQAESIVVQRCPVDGRLHVALEKGGEGDGEDDDDHAALGEGRVLFLAQGFLLLVAQLDQTFVVRVSKAS